MGFLVAPRLAHQHEAAAVEVVVVVPEG